MGQYVAVDHWTVVRNSPSSLNRIDRWSDSSQSLAAKCETALRKWIVKCRCSIKSGRQDFNLRPLGPEAPMPCLETANTLKGSVFQTVGLLRAVRLLCHRRAFGDILVTRNQHRDQSRWPLHFIPVPPLDEAFRLINRRGDVVLAG